MAISTTIDLETGIRMHTVTGQPQRNELFDMLRNLYSRPDFDPNRDVLWDMREADLTAFSTEDIQAIRDLAGRHWGAGGASRAALVVSTDVDFGLTRMYEMLMSASSTNEVRVFRDIDEAREWLGLKNS